MTYEERERSGVLMIKIGGALDAEAAKELHRKLTPAIRSRARQVMLNLKEVTSLSARAVGALQALNRAVKKRGGRVRVGMIRDHVRDTLKRCGARDLLPIGRKTHPSSAPAEAPKARRRADDYQDMPTDEIGWDIRKPIPGPMGMYPPNWLPMYWGY